MAEVYVLSGREYLGNSEWGYGCDDVSVWGVYNNCEKAQEAFKNKVLEIAKYLAENEEGFKYSEKNLFKSCEKKTSYGWNCGLSEHWSEWSLTIPETDDFDYGFWFQPVVILKKCEINKALTL